MAMPESAPGFGGYLIAWIERQTPSTPKQD
jgi:hypothetical protein